MKNWTKWVFAIGCVGTWTSPTAWAAPRGSVLEVVAPSSMSADDTSPMRVVALARTARGEPLEGLAFDVMVSGGTPGEVRHLGDGIYAVDVLASRADAAEELRVEFSERDGRLVASETIARRQASSASLVFGEVTDRVVLGETLETPVRFTLERADATVDDVALRTTTGRVLGLRSVGGGEFEAIFVPPEDNYPHLAIVTATDVGVVGGASGAMAVPLHGTVDFPVDGAPGERVRIAVGNETFGPIALDEEGLGDIPLVVAPGTTSLDIIYELEDGSEDVLPVDLPVPETQRVGFAPVGYAVTGDGHSAVTLRWASVDATGAPAPEATFELELGSGTLSETKALGQGLFEAVWTPDVSRMDADVTAQVFLDGSSRADAMDLAVRSGPPSSVSLMMVPDGGRARVDVRASDASAFDGRVPSFWSPAGAPVESPTVDGSGAWSVAWDSDRALAVALVPEPDASPVARVVVVPLPGAADSVNLLVVPLSAGGVPVAGVPIDLSAKGARLGENTVVSNAQGLAWVPASTLSDASHAVVSARMGEVEDEGAWWVNGDMAEPLVMGVATAMRDRDAWATSVATLGTDVPVADAAEPKVEPAVSPSSTSTSSGFAPPVSPWFTARVSVGMGSYGFVQGPGDEDLSLLATELAWGLGRGGAAVPFGTTLDINVQVPTFRWVGVHASGRTAPYAVSSALFNEDLRDVLWLGRVDLVGRYDLNVGALQAALDLRIGGRVDDILVFEGCTRVGCTLDYRSLLLPALETSVHTEVRVNRFRGELEVGGAFAYATVPYAVFGELRGGAFVTRALFVDAGLQVTARRGELEGQTSMATRGTVSDRFVSADLGVGVTF
ncbi:MAG: hypothetical protein ACON5B_08505 [Myxococcota bacterium]